MAAAALLAPLVGPGSTAGAANAPDEAGFASFINGQRASAGLPALTINQALVGQARGWTDQMLAAGSISHNPSLVAQAPAGWQRIGENVGVGSDVDVLNTAFWNSPPHRANILGNYDVMGIGVDVRADGMLFVTADFLKWQPGAAPPVQPVRCVDQNPRATPSSGGATGYYVLGSDGGIFSYGDAAFAGSVPGLGLRSQAVLMAVTPSQHGYWVLGADGGVFSFGDAAFQGSVPGVGGSVNGVDLKPTRSGNGYWILGDDGSVFAFGDATDFGSLPAVGVHTHAIRLVPTPSANGYWILGSDGGVFSFGDAVFHGSLPSAGVHNTSVSLAATPSGNGYWILGRDGGIFSFGDAVFHGSIPGMACQQAAGVQLVPSADGNGYYVLADDGRVFSFGDAPAYGQPTGLGVTALDLAVVSG